MHYPSKTNQQNKVDILIIGAGIVGSTLTIQLAELPLKICLIEKHTVEPPAKIALDSPVSLTPFSTEVFRKLKIWDLCVPNTQTIHSIHISEAGHFGKLRMHAQDIEAPELGYVVSRDQLTQSISSQLQKLIEQHRALTVYEQTQLVALNQSTHGWAATLKKNNETFTLHAGLVIGADGYHSQVRQLSQIQTTHLPTEEMALSAWIESSHPPPDSHNAFERFTDQGIFALLPSSHTKKFGVVWTGPTQMVMPYKEKEDNEWLQHIQTVFGYRFGKWLHSSMRSYYPIHRYYTEIPKIPGIVLLGNAAYSVSPIAAQGLNMNLQDLDALVDQIRTHLLNHTNKADRLSHLNLNNYHIKRYQIQQNMRQTLERLRIGTQHTTFPLPQIRSLGLLALDCSPLKKHLIKYFRGDYLFI